MREERPPLINQQSTGSLFKRGLCDANYRIYSAISRDPKICTCRLDITKTKNKSIDRKNQFKTKCVVKHVTSTYTSVESIKKSRARNRLFQVKLSHAQGSSHVIQPRV